MFFIVHRLGRQLWSRTAWGSHPSPSPKTQGSPPEVISPSTRCLQVSRAFLSAVDSGVAATGPDLIPLHLCMKPLVGAGAQKATGRLGFRCLCRCCTVMDHYTHCTVWACSRLRRLLSGPGQCPASGCLPSICTRPGVLRLVHPRPSPKLSRCPLAAAAAAAGDEELLAADGLGAGAPHARLEQEARLEPQLPEERGAAPAYPGGSVDVLGEQDVHAWQHRVSGAVRLVVASLQQQTLVLALAQHMQGS